MEFTKPGEKNWESSLGFPSEEKATLFYSGLTLLSKDLAENLAAKGQFRGKSQVFFDIYSSSMDSERYYWEEYGSKLFLTLEKAGLPKGFSQSTVEG